MHKICCGSRVVAGTIKKVLKCTNANANCFIVKKNTEIKRKIGTAVQSHAIQHVSQLYDARHIHLLNCETC